LSLSGSSKVIVDAELVECYTLNRAKKGRTCIKRRRDSLWGQQHVREGESSLKITEEQDRLVANYARRDSASEKDINVGGQRILSYPRRYSGGAGCNDFRG